MPKSDSKSDTIQKTRYTTVLALAAVVVLPAACAGAAPCRYNLTDLGTLPGYERSRAWSINNNGQVIGYAESDGPPYDWMKAVLFDVTGDGNNIDLGTLDGENSYAHSINIKGQIVGAADSNDFRFNWHATIFDANGEGNNNTLANVSWALSINDNGQIVGGAVSSFGYWQAILFDLNDTNNNTELGTVDGFNHSNAYAINNRGQIVGYVLNDIHINDFRATLFDPSGQGNNIDLGTLGGQYSAAISINDNGQIVGCADTTTAQSHATLFDPNGTGNNIDLGTIAGFSRAAAISINNGGRIVGKASNYPFYSDSLAVLFDPTGGGNNIELNGLINPELGWSLDEARCINDNGQIVGAGTNPDGDQRAILLTPATPGDVEPDRDVDFKDFAVFASAWKSKDGDTNWNVFCDISCPEDGVVDELDLSVFCSNWLAQQ